MLWTAPPILQRERISRIIDLPGGSTSGGSDRHAPGGKYDRGLVSARGGSWDAIRAGLLTAPLTTRPALSSTRTTGMIAVDNFSVAVVTPARSSATA